MLNGINNMIQAIRILVYSIFSLPFYDSVTWGHFVVACTIMAILISFFVNRMK